VTLRLLRTLAIEGRVVTDKGAPRADMTVLIVQEGAKPPFEFGGAQLAGLNSTDKQGAFRFPHLLPGRYTLGLGDWDQGGYRFSKASKPVSVDAGATALVFTTSFAGGFMEGKVLSKRTGQPLREFDVTLYRIVLFLPQYKGNTDFQADTGEFRVETDEAGLWSVEVDAKGHAPFRTKPKRVAQGETIDLGEIRLGDAGVVHGTVRDAAGQPVRWAKIHLLSPKLETNWSAPFTNEHGRYEVEGLAPGSYTLFAVSPSHPLALVKGVEIKEGGRTRIDVDFAPSAPLTIRVLDEQAQPIAGAKLIWTFDAIRPIDSSMIGGREPAGYGANVSDENGVIRKPFFPAGKVYLNIEAKGLQTVQRTVEMEPGQAKTVEVRLQRKP
jgi:protocatechuate 3,4-dioxygenase beta subunit